MLEEDLRERVIKEQDILVYMWYNYFEEKAWAEKIDSNFDISWRSFDEKIIAEDLSIIPKMSMNNLIYLLSSRNSKIKEIAHKEIMDKFRNGEHIFGGENAFKEMFGLSMNAWNKVNEELNNEIPEIKAKILSELEDLKKNDKEVYEIIDKSPSLIAKDNFLSVYEKGYFTPEKLRFLEQMAEQNPNILKNLNYEIFKDDIYEIGEEFISRVARYPNISNKLIKISANNAELFAMLKKGFKEFEEKDRTPEALALEEKIIRYAMKKCYHLEGASFEEIVNCSIRNDEIGEEINLDYISDYEKKYEAKCDEKFKNAWDIDKKKSILFSKYFGMSASTVQEFYTSYIQNIDQINLEDESLKKYIQSIKDIMQIEDEKEIDRLYYSISDRFMPIDRIHYEYTLREEYCKSYVEKLNATRENLENSSNIQYIEFEGKKIKQIMLGTQDLNALIHSTDSGFKGDKEAIDSFKQAWHHQKEPDRHLEASCFVTPDFMGHAPVNENGVLMVRCKCEKNQINLVGPTDINSHIKSYACVAGNTMYMTADNLPYYSRKVYSEVPIEIGDPDYILIYDDMTGENLKNAYRAAAEFDVPVIYEDKRDIEKKQLANLDKLIEKFEQTGDLDVLQNLVCRYETNVAGWLLNRDLSEKDESCTSQINNERFRADFEEKEQQIYQVIDKYLQNSSKENSEKVIGIMQNEIDKYNLIDIGKTPISKTKMKFDAQGIIDRINERLGNKNITESDAKKDNDLLGLDLTEIANSAIMRKEVDSEGVRKAQNEICMNKEEIIVE